MASPFKVFRKNQKAMLAVLTILTVFSFSVRPYFMDILGCGRAARRTRWSSKTAKFGNLTAERLELSPQRPAEGPRA